MLLRPVDSAGDVLPVLSSSDLLSGPEAVARLAYDRLNLYAGDWWENAGKGCRLLEMLRASRLTEADVPALSSYLTAYLRETPGVRSVEDVSASVAGRVFHYSCRLITSGGAASLEYSMGE